MANDHLVRIPVFVVNDRTQAFPHQAHLDLQERSVRHKRHISTVRNRGGVTGNNKSNPLTKEETVLEDLIKE